uniref:proline dehydrogenase 1, mitochondrial n=1 Tax=Myxine glutinosa TaxID=7769 RepID=UPI00358ED0E4
MAIFSTLRLVSRSRTNAPFRSYSSSGQAAAQTQEAMHMVDSRSSAGQTLSETEQVPTVDFADTREAYKSKMTWELVRGLFVYKLCSIDLFVDHHKKLLKWSERFLGPRLFELVMKWTIYGHFVAGENAPGIRPSVRWHAAFGVGSILDYSVEEDLSHEEAERKEMESCVPEAEAKAETGREKQFVAHRRFGDRRENVVSARTFFYADEAKCDQHMETFLHSVKTAAETSDDGFTAIKLTALGRPQFLMMFSEVLVKWRRFFYHLAEEQGLGEKSAMKKHLSLETLQDSLARLGVATRDETGHWLTLIDSDSSGTVDLCEWNQLIDQRTGCSRLLVVPNPKTGTVEPLLQSFTGEEEKQMKRMLQRMHTLITAAVKSRVRLMVDAEQSYFQPAISRLALEMMRQFNHDDAVIFNTYQCYLQEAYDAVTVDLELSRREGWHFGAKLVRGAYMEQERERAMVVGYPDPINPSLESTSHMYHRCLNSILKSIAARGCARVLVASHNEGTMKYTIQRMAELGLRPDGRRVYFGQLLGMCDHISFPLGQAGYPVYKYVPYGPVREVLPYLSRRAQENRGMMRGADLERKLLWTELKRRTLAGNLFYKPLPPPQAPNHHHPNTVTW